MSIKMADIRALLPDKDVVSDSDIRKILSLIHDEVDSIKDERDDAQAQLAEEKKKNGDDWKKKYEDEHEAFEAFKTEQTAKETTAQKKTAYKKMLEELGVSEQAIESVLRATDYKSFELASDGTIKDADTVKNTAKEAWGGFIKTQKKQGSSTKTPPENKGGGSMSVEDILKVADTTERQRLIGEKLEVDPTAFD